MFKAPFILSNLRGTQLWPTNTQLPTTVRIELIPDPGMTPAEINLAHQNLLRAVSSNSGRIKREFLRQRQASDLNGLPIANGVARFPDLGFSTRYNRNGGMETMTIRARAKVHIPQPGTVVEELPKPLMPQKIFLIVYYGWSPSSGEDLDTLTRFSVPETSGYLGWAGQSFTAGTGPLFSTRVGTGSDGIYYQGKKVLHWASEDNTTKFGPEVIIADLTDLLVVYPSVELELNANWYSEVFSGRAVITAELYVGAEPDMNVSVAANDTVPEVSGSRLVAAQQFSTTVTVFSRFVGGSQRVGRVTVTLSPQDLMPLLSLTQEDGYVPSLYSG